MPDAFFDKFIADLVKGASHHLRENGGVGVNILVERENHGHEEKLASAGGALTQRYDAGANAALERLSIKEAFLPMLGAIAGPALARMGLGRLAAGAGGKMLGGIAGKVAPRVAGGLGGAAFDQAAGMAGGALGQRLQPQQPQGAVPPL